MSSVQKQKVVKTTIDTLEFGEIDVEKEASIKSINYPTALTRE